MLQHTWSITGMMVVNVRSFFSCVALSLCGRGHEYGKWQLAAVVLI